MTTHYSCNVNTEPDYVLEKPAIQYSFPLDPFQKHAIAAIHQDHNVLVCAKTGSGKTLVAEYEIAYMLSQGKRVFYTTPIKSLSNQKFHDLKQIYPATGQVGIMTGDIKFCPDANIVIMTTEILRNLLYKQGTKTESLGLTASLSLKGLGAVIFDECHYINDKDRGAIWEETMILLPPTVQLILLSATLDSPQYFAEWLSQLKNVSCALIETQYRVVPLTHSVIIGSQSHVIMDAKENFDQVAYREWLQWRVKKVKDQEAYARQVKNARAAGHEGRVEGKKHLASFTHTLNDTIQMLEEKELLPALTFVFSRVGCEKYADKITHHLLDSSDSALAERIFDFHLRHHKENIETLPQYHTLRKNISRGIAFHHSGVLPVLKEAIEILFSKGLIKLLFATETFAVGINMPTKTVLFVDFYKFDSSSGLRILRTDEYIQMAGRAGRRGKDTIGHVFYLPEKEPPSVEELQKMMKGGKPRIESRMEFGYDFLLKTLLTTDLKWLNLLEKSYWYRQWEQIQKSIGKDIELLDKQMSSLDLNPEFITEIKQKKELEFLVQNTQNSKKRDAQRSLDKWKDSHLGPKWFSAEKNYDMYKKVSNEKINCENLLVDNKTSYLTAIHNKLQYLITIEFLENDKNTLTLKGMAATEFNEGHPILCTELAFRNTLSHLSVIDLVTCLACFITESDKNDQPVLNDLAINSEIKDALKSIGKLALELGQKEYDITKKDTRFWDLSTMWIEPVSCWLNNEHISHICTTYGIFEGNFVRTILRIASLVEEWISVASLIEDIKLLEKLQDVKHMLVRDTIVPDSLYLHL
jgi:superfamily II RNA helicase